MNQIETGQILDPTSQQPFSGKSLTFLQNASKEMVNAYVYAMLGENAYGLSFNRGLCVAGCTKSGSGDTIFNGFIFLNSELYFFPGKTGLNSFALTAVVVADTTYDTSIDPVKFSDGAMKNVHQVRRLKVVDQASGSGLFDLNNLIRIVSGEILTGSSTTTAGAGQTDITGLSYTTPTRVMDLEISIEATVALTPNTSIEGATLILRNATTSTNVATSFFSSYQPYAGPPSVSCHLTVKYIIRNVPASTNFRAQVQRFGADVTASTSRMIIKEISRPKLW